MANLASIRRPVDSEMREFQGHFKEAMRTSVSLLDHITRYIVKSKGKQMDDVKREVFHLQKELLQEKTKVSR